MNDSACGQQPDEKGWWAVYTRHQHEKSVSEMLVAKGTEVFLPLYQTERHRRYRTVSLVLPLFPGYLFVREQPEMRLSVLSTPGVLQIVSHGSELGVVPDAEIQNLQIAMAGRRGMEPHPFCRIGERVRIVRGPLSGLEGFLVRQKSVYRVVLSMQILAQAAAVEVHASEIATVHVRPEYSLSIPSGGVRYGAPAL